MPYNVADIAAALNERRKQCLLDLSDSWQCKGYSKTVADTLWAICGSRLWPDVPELVDCKLAQHGTGREYVYHHKLLPVGAEVQAYLKQQSKLH